MPTLEETIAWNTAIIADFRANAGQITAGPMAGAPLLLLTTTGARTGLPRTQPLAYTRDGERYVVIGSNAGKPEHPAWLANISKEPVVTVEVGAEAFQARADLTAGTERRRLFDAQAAVMPGFAEYEKHTERELPVVTLTPLGLG